MSKATSTVNIVPIPDHPLWYCVESWSQDTPNQVHLDDHGGNGGCNCADWNMVCLPNFKKNGGKWVEYGEKGRPNPERTMCKHVKTARRYLIDMTLRMAAQQLTERKRA